MTFIVTTDRPSSILLTQGAFCCSSNPSRPMPNHSPAWVFRLLAPTRHPSPINYQPPTRGAIKQRKGAKTACQPRLAGVYSMQGMRK